MTSFPPSGWPESLLKAPQVQVSRDQNNSLAPWVHANIHVFDCHVPNVTLVSVLFSFLTTTGGCEENYRFPGQSTQRNNLSSVLCHSLSSVAARTELCSGPHAVGKWLKLCPPELTHMSNLEKDRRRRSLDAALQTWVKKPRGQEGAKSNKCGTMCMCK